MKIDSFRFGIEARNLMFVANSYFCQKLFCIQIISSPQIKSSILVTFSTGNLDLIITLHGLHGFQYLSLNRGC